MKKTFQIPSVGLALLLLAGYVVYAQQQAARPVASRATGFTSSNGTAGGVAPRVPGATVAPSSKSLAPLMRSPQADAVAAPGSKSKQIFTPATTSSAGTGVRGLGGQTGAVVYSTKSAPIFPTAPGFGAARPASPDTTARTNPPQALTRTAP